MSESAVAGTFCPLDLFSLLGGGSGVFGTGGISHVIADGSGGGDAGYSDARASGIGFELLKLLLWDLLRLLGRDDVLCAAGDVIDVDGGMRPSSDEMEARRVEKKVFVWEGGVRGVRGVVAGGVAADVYTVEAVKERTGSSAFVSVVEGYDTLRDRSVSSAAARRLASKSEMEPCGSGGTASGLVEAAYLFVLLKDPCETLLRMAGFGGTVMLYSAISRFLTTFRSAMSILSLSSSFSLSSAISESFSSMTVSQPFAVSRSSSEDLFLPRLRLARRARLRRSSSVTMY